MSSLSPVAPGSTSDRTTDGTALDAEIAALSQLDLHQLRVRWRKLLRSPPPEHLSRSLLLRVLAYKLQARAYGDLDGEGTVNLTLDRHICRKCSPQASPNQPTRATPVASRQELKA
jgi:hypothetical protein